MNCIAPKIFITPATTDEKVLCFVPEKEEMVAIPFEEYRQMRAEEKRLEEQHAHVNEGCMQALLVDASLSLCTYILYVSRFDLLRLPF